MREKLLWPVGLLALRRDPPLQLAHGWAAYAASIGFVLILLAFMWVIIQASAGPHVDTRAYYDAAVALRAGAPLYGRALQWRDAGWTSGGPQDGPQTLMDYSYPPPLAIAFVPLTFLPFTAVRLLWMALNLGCLLGAARVLVATLQAPVSSRGRWLLSFVLAVALGLWHPIRSSLHTGNIDSVLLLFVALSFSAFISKHDRRAGGWLALAAVVKPFLGGLVLFYFWKRGYRAVVVCVGVAIVLTASSFLIVGPSDVRDYIEAGRYWTSPTFAATPFNQSLNGVLLRLFTANDFTVPLVTAPMLVNVVWFFMLGVMGLAWSVLVRRTRRLPPSRLGVEFGLLLCLILLLSPVSELLHFTYLAIPLVMLLGTALATRPLQRIAVAQAVSVAGVYLSLVLPRMYDVVYGFQAQGSETGTLPLSFPTALLTGVYFVALCFFTIVAIATLIAERRAARRSLVTQAEQWTPPIGSAPVAEP